MSDQKAVRKIYPQKGNDLINHREDPMTKKESDTASRGQLTGLPYYCGGGRCAPVCYPCGLRLEQMNDNCAEEAQMMLIEEASREDFEYYRAALNAEGYTEIWKNETEDNRYAVLSGTQRQVYLSYTASEKRLSVIAEDISESVKDLSEPEPKLPDGEAQFFLYGLNMDPGGYNPAKDPELNTSGYPNCGMLLAIRCPDMGVIVVDGGYSDQFRCGGISQLDAFLHRITGREKDEPVDIRAWLLTHFHPDHMEGFYELLHAYPERYRLQRVICNLPSFSLFPNVNIKEELKKLSALIGTQYPGCRELKVHTGERLAVGGVTLEVLYTHEDNADPSDIRKSRIRDLNDTGIVVRASCRDASLMILGDINRISEQVIVSSFSEAVLHSDIVQASHHNFNRLSDIYRLTGAPIAWFTQTERGIVKNEMTRTNSDEVKKYSREYRFSGDITRTSGFAKREGEMKEIYRYRAYLL